MNLICGDYSLVFREGGIEVLKNNKLLYFNKRPMFVTVKTAFAVNEFYDDAYSETAASSNKIIAKGALTVPSGSVFFFSDEYEAAGNGFRIIRNVKVLKAGDDLGFSTKISFIMTESDDTHEYNCFAPGVWYRQNEFAPDYAFGKDLACEYFWCRETSYALPLFAMQNIKSGETAAFSRWGADVTMRSLDLVQSENNTDPRYTIGSIGMSRPESKTVNYMYYGFEVRKEIATKCDGLSIDYVYPGCDGQMPGRNNFGGLDYKNRIKTFQRINHPVEAGFFEVPFEKYDAEPLIVSDTFNHSKNKLDLRWEWNHNPENTCWSFTERPGFLRLRTQTLADDILTARNTLTQRTSGPKCTFAVELDSEGMKAGDYASLVTLQGNYGLIGVFIWSL